MPAQPAAKPATKSKAASAKKSVSLPPDLMLAALARAGAEQRNFSSYIQRLVAQDLAAAKPDEAAA